jgi:threonine/homoserine/homoserine lactone efflux protein
MMTTSDLYRWLLSGALLGLTAVASPGPFQAYLTSQTIKNGWRKTMLAIFAPLISDGPIVLLVLFVLRQFPDGFLSLIQLAGGLLLVYFAWRAFRNFQQAGRAKSIGNEDPGEIRQQNLWEAALVNALSPGPWLFWSLMAGPLLVEGWQLSAGAGLGFLFGFYGALLTGLAVFIFLLGTASQLGPRLNRSLLGLSAVILFFFGIYQLYRGIQSLL